MRARVRAAASRSMRTSISGPAGRVWDPRAGKIPQGSCVGYSSRAVTISRRRICGLLGGVADRGAPRHEDDQVAPPNRGIREAHLRYGALLVVGLTVQLAAATAFADRATDLA